MTDLRTLTLHGDRVAYRDEGAGEALLLIHGMGGSSSSWGAIVPKLATKYRVIAPDLLGHGQSDKPRGDYSLGAFAVWLRDLLNVLDIPQVTVVGHSLGGGVALQFAHQHREYCRRLVLISSGGLGTDVGLPLRMLSLPGSELVLSLLASRPVVHAGNTLRAWVRHSSRQGKVTRFSEPRNANSTLTNRHSRQAFLRTLRSVVDHRGQAVSALNRLHMVADLPTLIINGDDDRVIPFTHAHAAHHALPGSHLHILPGVGHDPQAQRPDTVTDLIDNFIAGTGEHTHATTAAAGRSAPSVKTLTFPASRTRTTGLVLTRTIEPSIELSDSLHESVDAAVETTKPRFQQIWELFMNTCQAKRASKPSELVTA